MLKLLLLLIFLQLAEQFLFRSLYHNRYCYELKAINDGNDQLLPLLDETCRKCIENSRMKYKQGLSKAFKTITTSNTGNQIMEDEDKSPIINILNNTILSPSSDLAKQIMNSSKLLIVDLSPNSFFYTLTLFHVPAFQQLPSRRNIAGTILFYKSLYGTGSLVSSNKNRVIQKDELNGGWRSLNDLQNNDVSIDKGVLLSRIGGPMRTSEWKSKDLVELISPLGYIEIAIYTDSHPPISNWEVEQIVDSDDEDVSKLEPSKEELENLLTFYDRRQAALSTKPVLNNVIVEEKEKRYGNIKKQLSVNIGGLSNQLDDVVRRLLASRRLPPEIMKSLGLSHVRGILLYGPPGTGKTLIAREIAKSLNSREPKIVNGPEILDKFVGEAERNIRELFREADEEWERMNYMSELHVIIFDEIDAIAKKRGLLGDSSGVRDSVVNQLLTKIDGVRERNNVLVIGLTNRIDLLDEAIIRSGRLEVLIKISEPDREGREEILYIMLKPMILGNFLSVSEAKTWVAQISGSRTAGYTGADLGGLLRSAASFALNRYYNDQEQQIKIRWSDIENALEEMKTNKRLFKSSSILKSRRTLEEILYDCN